MSARRAPRHSAAAGHLREISQQLRTGVSLLSQLLGTPEKSGQDIGEELQALDVSTMNLHFALMTHIRSVFLTPLPREDIYMMSQQLNRTMEHIVAAGDLLIARNHLKLPTYSWTIVETLSRQIDLTMEALSRLDELDHLEEYWIQVQRLAKQANHAYRDWLTSTDDSFQPNIALQQTHVAQAMLAAVEAQRTLAITAGAILVRES
ncbi:MAG TPA: hypothetical protein H9871_09610 [Candidatus Nesterenkonia stercoripullorum]|jgi:uncharacterized protein Yka (UPF0111/DUF47 family)|uniref:Nuclease PIN n=1 Tax=Candidatus Nesterenkonia stercoripullorum TaxID=2838701 RepID=A0A9D1UU07_9MICC|nr:hypothetical protein [Candidatus Nesterenkonia stercoripullorum]